MFVSHDYSIIHYYIGSYQTVWIIVHHLVCFEIVLKIVEVGTTYYSIITPQFSGFKSLTKSVTV